MPRRSKTGMIRPWQYTTANGQKRWKALIDIGKTADGKRKRKSVTAKTYKDCQAKINNLIKQIRETGSVDVSRRTLYDVASEWLNQRRHEVDPKTYQMYKTIIDRHLGDYAGAPIKQMTPAHIQEIINSAQKYSQSGQPIGPASISLKKQLRTCLNQIMRYAVANRIITYNPVAAINPPKNKDSMQSRVAFSVPEIRSMLSAAADMPIGLCARWWFRLLTGMRQGEILGATWDKYDSRQQLYTVDWKLQETPFAHGCRRIDGRPSCGMRRAGSCPERIYRVPDGYAIIPLVGSYTLSRPKSRTGRIVPIIPPLAETLGKLKRADRSNPNPHNLLFHKPDGSPIDGSTDTRQFNELMAAAGIDPKTHTGHETRHSVVSLLASQGVDFQLIEEIVGHSSLAMVSHYRHADSVERSRAMGLLGEALKLE